MISVLIYLFTFAELIAVIILCRGIKLGTRTICMIGIISAATLILGMIRIPMPTGGSLRLLSVMPIMLLSLVYSPKAAFTAGLITAVLGTILLPGWALIHPMQFFVEHLVCMTSLGFAGIFGTTKKKMLCGLLLAGVLNLLGHIFAGVLFFGSYAPVGMGVWQYSIIYNLNTQGLENVLSIVLLMAIPVNTIRKAVARGGKA